MSTAETFPNTGGRRRFEPGDIVFFLRRYQNEDGSVDFEVNKGTVSRNLIAGAPRAMSVRPWPNPDTPPPVGSSIRQSPSTVFTHEELLAAVRDDGADVILPESETPEEIIKADHGGLASAMVIALLLRQVSE